MITKEEIDNDAKDTDDLTVPDTIDLTTSEELLEDTQDFLINLPSTEFLKLFEEDIIYSTDDEAVISHEKFKPCKILQDSFDEVKKACHFNTVKYSDYAVIKRQYNTFYRETLMNGFFTGFTAVVACYECNAVLDSFPCIYKRIFWIPKDRCRYCKGRYNRFSFKDMKLLEAAGGKIKGNMNANDFIHNWLE